MHVNAVWILASHLVFVAIARVMKLRFIRPLETRALNVLECSALCANWEGHTRPAVLLCARCIERDAIVGGVCFICLGIRQKELEGTNDRQMFPGDYASDS